MDVIEKIVNYQVSGLPVLENNKVVGVLSDYDLLAIDELAFASSKNSLFPEANDTWEAFRVLKGMYGKVGGSTAKDIMTADVRTIGPDMDVHRAINILIGTKIRRLIVTDEGGKLVGLFSRSNVNRALLGQLKTV